MQEHVYDFLSECEVFQIVLSLAGGANGDGGDGDVDGDDGDDDGDGDGAGPGLRTVC